LLDGYNNVPQAGHAHPHVVRAVTRQSATLNTNTRYLHASVVEYAEALAARLPESMSCALFVNSGSEANDLAWRIARAATGNRGALVTAHAYHGTTVATDALSPGGISLDQSTAPHVARLRSLARPGHPATDTATDSATPEHVAADARHAADRLSADGHGVAAFFLDPALSSDGILDPPAGHAAAVAEATRQAGGLCIADEVQSGFGRLGTYWGFEARGFVPDIVTLGKPIANGYPMGAVVTGRAVMAAFAATTDYFSTFGGNPVACLAALAVLDITERDDLPGNAARVGAHLRARLEPLWRAHAAIGDVRGRGLFVGIEIVDPAEGTPAPARAVELALTLRRRGVLVGTEGPHGNVIKIRPPLPFATTHADYLVDQLDRALGTDGAATR